MDVLRLDARTDFRMEKLAGIKMWLVPADAAAESALDKAWTKLTGGAEDRPRDITVKGRALHVPHSAHGVARFTFAELCEKTAWRVGLSAAGARLSHADDRPDSGDEI
jgi:cell division protein ZapE